MLRLENIAQSYGRKPVLADVSYDFGQGVTVITGPSGAGKTTLLRICATIEKPKTGTLRWNDSLVQKNLKRFRTGL